MAGLLTLGMVALPGRAAQAPQGALAREVAQLSGEVARLEAASAVKKLQRAFGYYIDKGYWDDAAALFTPDATLESGADGVYAGRQRIREYLIRQGGGNSGPGLPYGQYNRHFQLQPVVTVSADGRSASARWRNFGMTGQYQQNAFWGDGIYENTYALRDGAWQIQSMHYYENFKAPYEGGWAKLAAAPADWRSEVSKAFPADRRSTVDYRPYPEQFTPPYHYAHPVRGAAARKREAALPAGELGEAAAAVRGQLAQVRSVQDIENLQAAFGYYIDKGRWDDAAALFARSGSLEWGLRGVYEGPTKIRGALAMIGGGETLPRGALNNHLMLSPIVTVARDNRTARARWRNNSQLARDGTGYWAAGILENEYVNEGGIWKIAKLHYYITGEGDYERGFHAGAVPVAGPSREFPPDRPPTEIYQPIPAGHFPKYHYANPAMATPPAASAASRLASSPPSGDALADGLRDVAQRVARLDDEQQLERLQRAYSFYVDKSQFSDVSNLFTENTVLEIGGRGQFLGRNRVFEYMGGLAGQGFKPGNMSDHQNLQGIVSVAPDGATAKARWSALVINSTQAGGVWGDVTYENDYVKENGVWKISRLRAPFTMYTSYKDGWGKVANANTRPDSWPPVPDLAPSVVYLMYPNFFNEPFHYPNPVTGRPSPPPHPAAGGTAPMNAQLSGP